MEDDINEKWEKIEEDIKEKWEKFVEELISTLWKVVEAVSDIYTELLGSDILPRYLIFEMKHPKKKPRGSIRRARKGENNGMDKT